MKFCCLTHGASSTLWEDCQDGDKMCTEQESGGSEGGRRGRRARRRGGRSCHEEKHKMHHMSRLCGASCEQHLEHRAAAALLGALNHPVRGGRGKRSGGLTSCFAPTPFLLFCSSAGLGGATLLASTLRFAAAAACTSCFCCFNFCCSSPEMGA
eukprot:752150-Hanusia_phi.AAC.4